MKIKSIILVVAVAALMSGCIGSGQPYLPLYQAKPEKVELEK